MRIRTGMGRTTTQMVSNTRRRAGLVSRRGLLYSSLKGKSTGTVSRLAAMNASTVQSAAQTRLGYEKLQKSAGTLVDQTKLLAEKVDAGGKDITAAAEQMVANFNDTIKYLKQSSGVLNSYYQQSMKEISTTNKKELEEIGITVATDGTLTLNKNKLAAAGEEAVKKLLSGDSDFVKRINTVAERVADNARINVENSYSSYDSAGSIASMFQSRYNYLG